MKPYILIVSAVAVWSTWGLAVRGVEAPVTVVAFYNALFAMVFQGAGLLFVGRRRAVDHGGGLGWLFLLAVCGLLNLLLFTFALKEASIAGALLTHYTAPVFVAVLAPVLLGDRNGRLTIYALGASVAGLLMIFFAGAGGLRQGSFAGLAAGTASGLAYAFIIIISRRISSKHYPLKVVFVQAVLTVVLLGAWLLPAGGLRITIGQAAIFAVLGLLHSTLAVMVYLYGIRSVTAQEAGILGYLEPVLGIILAYMFLGETPHPLAVAGGVMIVTAGSMVIMHSQPQFAEGLDDNRR